MARNNFQTDLCSRLGNFTVTMLCWGYFIFAFLFFFSFFYMAASVFAKDKERAFQYLNHLFYKGFFRLLRLLAPRHRWELDPGIAKIHGAIIVCNHLSYLDPLLLISLLPCTKTIVKTKFFKAPVFGWLISVSGYLPATTEGVNGRRMIEQMENMAAYLQTGGNLFVFPEGTRSRNTILGELHKGVFKIARMQRCPIHVLSLRNTDMLFTPGQFFFKTGIRNRISLKILDSIEVAAPHEVISVTRLKKQVQDIFQERSSCQEGVL